MSVCGEVRLRWRGHGVERGNPNRGIPPTLNSPPGLVEEKELQLPGGRRRAGGAGPAAFPGWSCRSGRATLALPPTPALLFLLLLLPVTASRLQTLPKPDRLSPCRVRMASPFLKRSLGRKRPSSHRAGALFVANNANKGQVSPLGASPSPKMGHTQPVASTVCAQVSWARRSSLRSLAMCSSPSW